MTVTHQTHFDTAGTDSARTIVLVHGVCCTRTYWLPQVEALSAEYGLLMVDLPGHGSRCREPFTLARAVQQLHEVVTQQCCGPVLLMGHSLGGYVVQAYLAEHPETTCGAVLVDCTAGTRSPLLLPYQLYAWLCTLVPDPLLCGIETALGSLRFSGESAAALREGGLYHQAVPAAIAELRGADLLPRLVDYDKPVMVLNGAKDLFFRRAELRYCETLPNAQLRLVPNARHSSNLDQPEAFSQAVLEFARTLDWPVSS